MEDPEELDVRRLGLVGRLLIWTSSTLWVTWTVKLGACQPQIQIWMTCEAVLETGNASNLWRSLGPSHSRFSIDIRGGTCGHPRSGSEQYAVGRRLLGHWEELLLGEMRFRVVSCGFLTLCN